MTGMVLRPLSVGEVLDRAFQVYRRSFASMYLVALIGALPLGVLMVVVARGGGQQADPAASIGYLLLLLPVVLVSTLLAWGALAELVDRSVKGEPAAIGAGLARGLRAFLPLLGALLVVGFFCGALSFPFGIAFGILGVVAGTGQTMSAGGAIALFAVMFAMMVVIGLVWISLGFFLTPVIVVERKGPIAAVGRSFQLGKGGRWRVVGIAVIAALIGFLPGLTVDIVPFILSAMRGHGAPGLLDASGFNLYLVIKVAVSALTTPFTAGCMMMAYYDRRVRLEGLDVELASAALEPTS